MSARPPRPRDGTDAARERDTADVYRDYQPVEGLGSGTAGVVELVKSVHDGTLCVHKTINVKDETDSEEIRRLMAEVTVLSSLDHALIIAHKESFLESSGFSLNLHIFMQYASKGDLGQRIDEQRAKGLYFSENRVSQTLAQLALAVEHIHARGIIHRDLKPQNIFLGEDENILLGDFGLTRVLSDDASKAMSLVGTPYYISPELVRNEPYSKPHDLWAVGIVFYKMCALKQAWKGDTITEVTDQILHAASPRIAKHYARPLQEIVERLLEKDQHTRMTASQLVQHPTLQPFVKKEYERQKELKPPPPKEAGKRRMSLKKLFGKGQRLDPLVTSPRNVQNAFASLDERYSALGSPDTEDVTAHTEGLRQLRAQYLQAKGLGSDAELVSQAAPRAKSLPQLSISQNTPPSRRGPRSITAIQQTMPRNNRTISGSPTGDAKEKKRSHRRSLSQGGAIQHSRSSPQITTAKPNRGLKKSSSLRNLPGK